MSMVTAKINFYNVLECGYYHTHNRKHAFCTHKELLSGLASWTKDKKIGETVTFTPLEDSPQNKIYCYDIHFDSKKGALLTTWNGYETTEDNSIAAINAFAPVGTHDIKSTEFSDEYIPGFETYFWFPRDQKSTFATVCFERRQNGRRDMVSYLEGFLATSHPEYTYVTDEGEILYKELATDKGEYVPAFSCRPTRLPGALQQIKSNWSKVRKLRQQVTLCPLVHAKDKAFWQTWLQKLNLAAPSVREEEVSFDTKVGWTPTEEELEAIINEWTTNSDSIGRMGVIFAGESQKTYWFDTTLAKSQINLDVEKNEHGIVNAESLFQALDGNKEQIFAQAYRE